MIVANILFWIGVVLLVVGGINVIRFDGSIKRVITCLILVFIGIISLYAGTDIKNNIPIEYRVKTTTELNTSIRVNLETDRGTLPPIYIPKSEKDKYIEGETVILTKKEIKEYEKAPQ